MRHFDERAEATTSDAYPGLASSLEQSLGFVGRVFADLKAEGQGGGGYTGCASLRIAGSLANRERTDGARSLNRALRLLASRLKPFCGVECNDCDGSQQDYQRGGN
jgi:hypothetical protein